MKTILLVTTLSFMVICGGLFMVLQRMKAESAPHQIGGVLTGEDVDAAEMMLAALDLEREQLEVERDRILMMKQDLTVQSSTLQEQLEELRATIEGMRSEERDLVMAKEESVVKLAKMFDAMKPAAAAPVFSSLDKDTALQILVRMKNKSAAKLLSAISPDLAADLSERLSEGEAR